MIVRVLLSAVLAIMAAACGSTGELPPPPEPEVGKEPSAPSAEEMRGDALSKLAELCEQGNVDACKALAGD
ncbi:MAG TPA: hypothetical protein VKA18_11820 [Alphaproteobacteria bacterium]|nr:hypothetical protein [Alphaproteobacteria bacterium]